MKKFVSIITIVVAFAMVVMLNTSVYDTQNQRHNKVEVFKGTGYFDNVTLTYDSTVGDGDTRSLEFTSDGSLLAVGIASANKLRMYEWNVTTESYDVITPNLNVSGVGSVLSVEFDDADEYLVVGHTTSPYIKVYDVLNNYDSVVDPDLIVDGVVYDSKYYEDEYLIVGGDMTNYLQVFKYVGGSYVKLSNNIDVLPTDRVTDISYADGYLFVSTLATPYLIVYEVVGDNLVKIANPSNLPSNSANVVETSDNGMIVVVGITASPFVKAYKFVNGTFTDVTFDVEPTQTLDTLALHFIDNSYLYVGGDNAVYKYKLVGDELIQQTNDVTIYETPVNVIDCTTVVGRFVLGDINDYELYRGTSIITFDNITLEYEPDVVNSVKQLGVEKNYLLIDNIMSITNEVYNRDITVDYDYVIVEENQLLEMMPLLALVGLVLAVGTIAVKGGRK